MSKQTFKQRKANEKFAKKVALERKGLLAKTPKKEQKSKLSTWLVVLVCFALLGSGILEILRIFF